MKYVYDVEWVECNSPDYCAQMGDYVREMGTGKICILGETGSEGFSELYNLDGSFYDITDMWDPVKPRFIEKKKRTFWSSWFGDE